MHPRWNRILTVAVAALIATPSKSVARERTEVAKLGGSPEPRCANIDRNPGSSGEEVWKCRVERDASDKLLFAKAISGSADPVREARSAADAGDFRLMGYSMLVPGTFPAAYGISCRPSIVSQGYRMVRALYVQSDVPPASKADFVSRIQNEKRHRAFGMRYNFTLINDNRSPFRSVCRVVPRSLEEEGFPPG